MKTSETFGLIKRDLQHLNIRIASMQAMMEVALKQLPPECDRTEEQDEFVTLVSRIDEINTAISDFLTDRAVSNVVGGVVDQIMADVEKSLKEIMG